MMNNVSKTQGQESEINWVTHEAYNWIQAANEDDYLRSMKIVSEYPIKAVAAEKLATEFSHLSALDHTELIDWEYLVTACRDEDDDEEYLKTLFPKEWDAYEIIDVLRFRWNVKTFQKFLEELILLEDGKVI